MPQRFIPVGVQPLRTWSGGCRDRQVENNRIRSFVG